MEFCFWLDYLPTRHDWYGWVYMSLTCGLMTTTGWDGMGYIIIAIYMKHDTINNQPTNQRKKDDANNNNTNILQIHFYDDTPSFEKDNVFFWMDGWTDGWMEKKRERKRELYNVEKMNLEKPT